MIDGADVGKPAITIIRVSLASGNAISTANIQRLACINLFKPSMK